MILSKNTKRAFVFITIFTFSFMFFGCDYVKEKQTKTDQTPLKGKKITTEYLQKYSAVTAKSDCCTGKYSSFEVYSINTKSPKAKEIENRIISDLKSFDGKDTKKMSSVDDPEQFPDPNMGEGIIIENTDNGREVIATPLDNGIETINQRVYIPYDSETNSVSTQSFYYTAETNLTSNELNTLETTYDNEIASNAIVNLEIKDESGSILFEKNLNETSFNSIQSKSFGNATTSSCFGNCFQTVVLNMPWYQYVICAFKPTPCVIGISITCGMHCWVYDGRYL